MSSPSPLRLKALATKLDRPWVPQLEQANILIKGLSHICALDQPEIVPDQPFVVEPCREDDIEDVDEGLERDGIDFLGQYAFNEKNETTVTLNMCRIRRLTTRHGFHFEDVVKIVLLHELAHFVTHRGKSLCPECWVAFEAASSEQKESIAQQATHLYLRVAGYGQLVQVFHEVSHDCPLKYNDWMNKWKRSTRGFAAESFKMALQQFRAELFASRKKEWVPDKEDIHDMTGYDE